MDEQKRSAGVLLHVTSLPGKYGIGSLGKEAYRFADLIADSGVKYWQILPLVQTGYGDSPYSSVSCQSGNPYLIDLPTLNNERLLTKAELKSARLASGKVDYGTLYHTRYAILRTAYSRFNRKSRAFRSFMRKGEFDDYALFMTAKTLHGGAEYLQWEQPLKERDSAYLSDFREKNRDEYEFWLFLQFKFMQQWSKLKKYVNGLGIEFIGDLPLYVAGDSADVWSRPDLFQLDERLNPVKVAGVPPDYFSSEGQLWGNPVYAWDRHKAEGYAWWHNRLKKALTLYDVVRIDHFRGLDRYYEVPADAKNAIVGEWKDGPKKALFDGLTQEEREHIIAEDLGTIDDGVKKLLKNTAFPNMKVLLFAFDGNPHNDYLPKRYKENCVVYTGTHDNDTVAGYMESLDKGGRTHLRKQVQKALRRAKLYAYMGKTPRAMATAFMRLALQSKAKLAVIPVQDILGFNNESRMNTPGTEQGNWSFRLKKMPSKAQFSDLKDNIKLFGR